jgi:putative ABC transport system substrate-binding protein
VAEDLAAFRQGLRDHQWVEGHNIAVVQRDVGADLERQQSEVEAMIALGVRLILSSGPSATTAIMKVDPSIPIVIAGGGDPLAAGFITSYAQPGGRVTGVVSAEGFDAKRVEILKEVVPSARRLAFITNLGIAGQKARAAVTESTAQQLGMQARVFDARALSDIETAFERARGWGADAVVPSTNNPMANARAHVLALVSRNRLPAIYGKVDWARAGGLVGYGPNFRAVYRRAAAYVDKILRGAVPADLPVERSSAFELVVNRRALTNLSLTVPPAVAPLVTEWVD